MIKKGLGLITMILISLQLCAQVSFFGEPEGVSKANTAHNEGYLYVSPTGELIFSRDKYASNIGGVGDPGDLWLEKEGGFSNTLFAINKPNNFITPLGFSPDGKHFLYQESEKILGRWEGRVLDYNLGDASTSEFTIPSYSSHTPTPSGCISVDGQYLILSLERSNGYGVEDLYVCKKNMEGSWDSPQTLGYQINTPLQEITPFLAVDNRTLFFATNARNGFGSFDLYQTIRLDDTWRNWSEPKNLGNQVNSEGAEMSFGFVSGAEYAYFISTQNSDGYGDVKRIKIKADTVEDTTSQLIVEQIAEIKPGFTFNLVNAKSDELISGKATFGSIIIDAPFLIADTLSGDIEFKAEGFLSKEVKLPGNYRVGEAYAIGLEPLESGNIITLNQVLFYRGTANIIEGSERELDLVVEMMIDHPEVTIFLKGHTDNVGDQRLNLQLSNERVLTVKEYLVNKGIESNRIDGKGYGGSNPIADNTAEETRQLNRRVEFEVIRK